MTGIICICKYRFTQRIFCLLYPLTIYPIYAEINQNCNEKEHLIAIQGKIPKYGHSEIQRTMIFDLVIGCSPVMHWVESVTYTERDILLLSLRGDDNSFNSGGLFSLESCCHSC